MAEAVAIPPARLRYIGSVPQSLVANRVVPLNKEVVSFGRDKNKVDVFLDSARVPRMISRVHAIMRVQEDKWILNDNRSVNGAYVNGQLVKGNIAVNHGDTVVFGRHYPESEFVYRFEEGEESDQPPVIQPASQIGSIIVSTVAASTASAPTGFASTAPMPPRSEGSWTSAQSAPVPPPITPIIPATVGLTPAPAPAAAAAPAPVKETGGKLGSELEEEFTCSICQSLIARASTLPCSHSFCSECITHWLGRKRTCPSCREAATLMNLVPSRVLDNAIDRIKHLVLDEDDLEDHRERVERWDKRPPPAANSQSSGGGKGPGGSSTLNVLTTRALSVMYAANAGRGRGSGPNSPNMPPPPPRMPPSAPDGSGGHPPPPRGPPSGMGPPNMQFQGMNLGRGVPPGTPPPGMGGMPSGPGRGMMRGGPGGPAPGMNMQQMFQNQGRMPPGMQGMPGNMGQFGFPNFFQGMGMGGMPGGGMPPPGMPFNITPQTTSPGQVPGAQAPPTGGGRLMSSRVLFARGPAFQQRQGCRLCGVQVTQGTICIQGTFATGAEGYYHVPCFCLDESVPRVERPSDFPGYRELDATERAAFETLLVQGIRERMEREAPRQRGQQQRR